MAVSRLLHGPPVGDADLEAITRAVREIAADLDLVRRSVGSDAESAGLLQAAGEELHVVEEEIAAQVAELDAAARARREEHLLTRRLLATLPVPLISTDASGAVLEANAAAAELLGVPVDRLVRKPLFAYLAGDSRRIGRRLLAHAATREATVDGALLFTPRGGTPVTCRVTLVPVPAQEAGFSPPDGARVVDSVRWVVELRWTGDETSRAAQAALVELCRLGVAEADLRVLLRRVTELACEGIPEVAAASVVVGDPAEPELLASSSAVAQAGDGVQHLAGSGPVFDAYRDGRPVGTADLFLDPAWPLLARDLGSDRPVHGCLALPLFVGAGTAEGVLTLYARAPGRLDPSAAAERARPYVVAAEALVRDGRLVEELATVRDQLQTALTSRAVIDQAKGIVMTKRRCSADEAFALLVRMSNTGNRKLRDLARQIVDQASAPAP